MQYLRAANAGQGMGAEASGSKSKRQAKLEKRGNRAQVKYVR